MSQSDTVREGCRLGHRQRSYECPGCSEALGLGEAPVEHWRWFRGRTSSKRVKAAIDEYLKRRVER